MRKAKHGFWDEEHGARVDAAPAPSAEEEFFASLEPEAEPPCTQDELYEAMNQLTARQAFCVRLHYGLHDEEPMTQQEIASLAGWHLSTVQEHLFRAEQKLHKILTGNVRRNTP